VCECVCVCVCERERERERERDDKEQVLTYISTIVLVYPRRFCPKLQPSSDQVCVCVCVCVCERLL